MGSRVKVLHQVLDPSGIGGVSSEFKALENSGLSSKYRFSSMILEEPHRGVNLADISFYYRSIIREKPDIIHVRGAGADSLNAVIAARLYGKGRILVAVHGMCSDLVYISRFRRWVFRNIVERLIFKLSDGISCVCESAHVRPYFEPYRKKLLPYVYNRFPVMDVSDSIACRAFTRREYCFAESDIVGLFVGRMTREKGLDTVLEVFSRMKDDWPANLKFVFVGDGDYLCHFRRQCMLNGYPVIFAGRQSDTVRFYFASDYFILPSLHENHSISLLEACAAGMPAIATRCGGNPEIVNESIGILVTPGSAAELLEAVHAMYDNDRRMGYRKNLEMMDFSKFSDHECDKALDEVYERLLL